MATPLDTLTRPELAVMKHLWAGGEKTAREIHNAVSDELGWSYSTMRTVLERMTEKGLLNKVAAKNANAYEAAVTKVSVIGQMIADFSTRVLELDKAPGAAFFAESKLLDETEIDELENMLRTSESE